MIRRAVAVVVCSAAMLAYWLGFGSIVRGTMFGVPFGWAFGTAVMLSVASIPFTVDRDDPAMLAGGFPLYGMLACLLGATAGFGAGIALHSSPAYWTGAALGAVIGWPLGYWAFGDDRRQRGVPRVTGSERRHGAKAVVPRQ